MKRLWAVLTATWGRYSEEHGHLLAAAFSLYSLLAIAPLFVIAVGIAGLVVDPDHARRALLSSVERGSSQGISSLLLELLDSTRRHVLAIERLFEQDFDSGLYGRLRDVIEGPDGAVYVSTSNRDGRNTPQPDDDRILRIVPASVETAGDGF